MNRLLRLVLAIVLLAAAPMALAVDLQNEDNKAYAVKIHTSSGTTTTSIEAGTTVSGIYSGDGEIEIEGVGTIKAGGNDVVVIKNGKITKK